ncbi:fumarylacetoacetate hydrolase, partial [Gryllotalpicola reticulitermitis]
MTSEVLYGAALVSATLPADSATLVGRLFDPAVGGPCVVAVRGDRLVDLTGGAATVAGLLERDEVVEFVRGFEGDRSWSLDDVVAATFAGDVEKPRLLAPVDLQVIKAAGVTFATSMLERVIEERSKGDPAGAAAVRERVASAVGGAIASVVPGS